jgi:uncharacterized protein
MELRVSRWGEKLPDIIQIPEEHIIEYCRRWKITEFALFGSVLRDDFRPESDVDVLVSFSDDAHWTLFDHVEMQDELKAMFGRDVDVVSKRAIERSRNAIRRKAILNSAEVIYVQP